MFRTQGTSILHVFINQQVAAPGDTVATVQTPDSHFKVLNGRYLFPAPPPLPTPAPAPSGSPH